MLKKNLYKIAFSSILLISFIFFSSAFEISFSGLVPNPSNIGIQATPCGPDTVNITVQPDSVRIISVKYLWQRNTGTWDSISLVNTSGNSWRGIMYVNGDGIFKNYFRIKDSLNRVGTLPAGAPTTYYNFVVDPDTTKPVITHMPIQNTPKAAWPVSVTATVTDNCGIDSVWVRWRKNNGVTKQFKLYNTSGNIFSSVFVSTQSEVALGDSIFYRIIAQDNSSLHNRDSTTLYSFIITPFPLTCFGSDAIYVNYPFNTSAKGSRTQILWTASEINPQWGFITRIGFYVYSSSSQTMNNFSIKFGPTTLTSLTEFVNAGLLNVYSGNYTIPGSGWHYIDFQNYFLHDGISNLLMDICFENTSSSTPIVLFGSNAPGKVITQSGDSPNACTNFSNPTVQTVRPNICFAILTPDGTKKINSSIPDKYYLSQNYPNPFNPITRINFDIPKEGFVSLRIYDVLGREVKELLKENKSPGSYSIDFNAGELSSGLYIYKLESNGFIDTKRMVIIK